MWMDVKLNFDMPRKEERVVEEEDLEVEEEDLEEEEVVVVLEEEEVVDEEVIIQTLYIHHETNILKHQLLEFLTTWHNVFNIASMSVCLSVTDVHVHVLFQTFN